MATSLAELESHSASHPIECDAPPCERTFPLLLVSALTLFAVAINGYHPYAEDGGLYMAGVKRLLDPALYPHSTAFVLEPMRHSLFAPTVAAAVRLTRLSLSNRSSRAPSGQHLADALRRMDARVALLAQPPRARRGRSSAGLLARASIAGTALLFMDPYATARSLSTPAMLFALAAALDSTARGSPFNLAKRKDSAAFSSAPQASPSLLQCIL